MKIAICSDEPYPIHNFVLSEVRKRGHEAVLFGSLVSGKEESWAKVARDAALAISRGECDEGVFFCWTATGISMAANKVPGIRAALCTDAETAQGARIWNHANVLALSNRLMTEPLTKAILDAWFDTAFDPRGDAGVTDLKAVDEAFRKR
jgi:ribose 5-phosphate isomerase B